MNQYNTQNISNALLPDGNCFYNPMIYYDSSVIYPFDMSHCYYSPEFHYMQFQNYIPVYTTSSFRHQEVDNEGKNSQELIQMIQEQQKKQELHEQHEEKTLSTTKIRKIQKKCQSRESPKMKGNNQKTKIKRLKSNRNQFSNAFRAFLRLLSGKCFKRLLQSKFQRIKEEKDLKIKYDQFLSTLHRKAPNFTNYVNKLQFGRLYLGQSEFSYVFRVFFNDFIHKGGILHIMTASLKRNISMTSIMEFLQALRNVKGQLMKEQCTIL